MLSIMDHTPGQGQYTDYDKYQEKYNHAMGSCDVRQIVAMRGECRNDSCEKRLLELLNLARSRRIPVASHDDDTAEKVRWHYSKGISIAEFPVTRQAMEEAMRMRMHVSVGAPNILRGKSHNGNLNVLEAIDRQYTPIICSDYSPLSMIYSLFRMHEMKNIPLNECVNSVSLHPARASGIDSYTGSIEVGKDADIIIAERKNNMINVLKTVIHGEEIYSIGR